MHCWESMSAILGEEIPRLVHFYASGRSTRPPALFVTECRVELTGFHWWMRLMVCFPVVRQVFAQCPEDGISCHIRSNPSWVLPFFFINYLVVFWNGWKKCIGESLWLVLTMKGGVVVTAQYGIIEFGHFTQFPCYCSSCPSISVTSPDEQILFHGVRGHQW